MSELKEYLHNLSPDSSITERWDNFKLKWSDQTAGFDIFDLTDRNGHKIAIGDDADYLHLFMAVAEQVYKSGSDLKPLIVASDAGGKHLFVKYYTREDKEQFKYAYVALGNAVNQLPESAINGQLSFFAEISLASAAEAGFEKEARKAARSMSGDIKQVWESLLERKLDFLKTDLYVFQLLKLYSWGFQIVKPGGDVDSDYQFVRADRPKPRGASRH